MTYAATILADSPVVYWRLGEASGTAADNAEGTAARDGTYVNTPTLGVAGALIGDADTAVTLARASSEYVQVADQTALDLGNGPLSYECWIKVTDAASTGYLMSKGTHAAALSRAGTSGVVTWAAQAWATGCTSSVSITDTTTWHHIVGTKSAANAWLLYIDGADCTTYVGVPTTVDTATDLFIGCMSTLTNYFGGSMDEVAIYNYVLTSTQVAAHYAAAHAIVVTPGVAALTLSAFAPTVTATAHQLVTPGLAALTTALFAPAVTLGSSVVPTTASLTTATFAPTVTASAIGLHVFQANVFQANVFQAGGTPVLATPGVVALLTATYDPIVTASDHQLVTPPVASLTLALYAPTIPIGTTVTPGLVALTTATFAATVSVSDNKTATPPAAAMTTATFAPVIALSDNQTATPPVASLVTATFAPTVATTAHQTATPGVASLALTAFAPDAILSDHQTVTPGLASLSLTAFAPGVTASDHQLVTASPASLTLVTFAPTVTAGLTITPGVASLVLSTFAASATVTYRHTPIILPLHPMAIIEVAVVPRVSIQPEIT